MIIISLVEEYILPVFTKSSMLLKDTVSTDAVLHAQLFPKLVTDYKLISEDV